MRVEEHKVLGVPWNSKSNRRILKLAHDLRPTKKNVISLVGKFYDLLGFLSPVIIKFKILLCQLKSDWNEVILRSWWESGMALSQISILLHQCRLLEATSPRSTTL